MKYGAIKKFDVADGEGVRVSLFVSGCRNCCKGCFQPQTWSFDFGEEFTHSTENEIIEALKPVHVQGFSLLGGEPFEEENQAVLAPFLERLKNELPEKDIWCWTGYVYEKDLLDGCRKHTEFTDRMLNCIDVLVDGPFIQEERNLMLQFRGSNNQRILRLKDSRQDCGAVCAVKELAQGMEGQPGAGGGLFCSGTKWSGRMSDSGTPEHRLQMNFRLKLKKKLNFCSVYADISGKDFITIFWRTI